MKVYTTEDDASNLLVRTASVDQLDAIVARTEYAESGVAIGEAAAKDQDLRRAAQREIARRMGLE